jgi:hypothetical protein
MESVTISETWEQWGCDEWRSMNIVSNVDRHGKVNLTSTPQNERRDTPYDQAHRSRKYDGS